MHYLHPSFDAFASRLKRFLGNAIARKKAHRGPCLPELSRARARALVLPGVDLLAFDAQRRLTLERCVKHLARENLTL
jgi:hypothetical protein